MEISSKNLYTSISSGLFYTIVCAMFCMTPKSHAQVVVEMKLDTAEILVGQQVQLSTTVSTDKSQQVKFPSYQKGEELVKGLEVIDESRIDTNFINDHKRVQLLKKYTITSFDSAIYNIPAMTVLVDGDSVSAKSPVGLKVNVVPVDTTKIDLFAGPHAVVPEAFSWRNRLMSLSLILWLVLLLVFAISIKLTRHKPLTTKKVIKPQIPPHKQASSALHLLDVTNVKDQEDAKHFHIALTDALRVYLQRRFNVLALEKTTEEILNAMENKVNEQALSDLKFIFETADLAKFAKCMTSEFEMTRCLNAAQKFLDSTLDEVLENPEPEIQIIVLNDGMQKKFRTLLWVALSVLLIGGIIYACYLSNMIAQTYL